MRMIKMAVLITFVSIFVLIAGCNENKRYVRTVEMPLEIVDGQKLVLSSNVGSIAISGKNIENGSIIAKITGKGDTVEKAKKVAESISIKVEGEIGRNNVCIKINKPIGVKDNWYAVDYTIESPENISVKSRTNVGSISISNIKGDITTGVNVGSVSCKNIFGKVNLKTNVGNITLIYNEHAPSQIDSVLSTDIGNITFQSPDNLSAQVNATTNVGSINTRLPITVKGNLSSKNIRGVIGNGEGSIKLKTNVGSINIK